MSKKIESNPEKQTAPQDDIFRLVEMSEAMNASINNAMDIMSQQVMLIEVIKLSDRHEQFIAFVASLEEQNANIENQVKELRIRLEAFDRLKAACENTAVKAAVLDALAFLGIFKNK